MFERLNLALVKVAFTAPNRQGEDFLLERTDQRLGGDAPRKPPHLAWPLISLVSGGMRVCDV